jgi:hypothetical protein
MVVEIITIMVVLVAAALEVAVSAEAEAALAVAVHQDGGNHESETHNQTFIDEPLATAALFP